MMDKHILPENFDFGVPSVDIVDCGRKGLDKTAMLKRASAFDDIIGDIQPKPNRTYLHVITTGAYETYQANRNGDAFNETNMHLEFPFPENPKMASYDTDGGLKEFHDKTYMDKAAVYQEHHTKDTAPSGEIIAAKYNDSMHRGELLIAVDTEKWHDRLEKKASGQDIYLSMGCSVPRDVCVVCGRIAKTASEHCDHFKHMRCQTLEDGTQCCVMNDAPHFYDISGVDVPADRIAFVLRKVASGEQVKEASLEAVSVKGVRRPMLLTKSARILQKLSKMEKQVAGLIEGDKDEAESDAFEDDDEAQKDFTLKVRNYPADEVIDSSSRKGILLSPGMLFKLIGKEVGGDMGEALCECDDDSCGDCSAMMRELEDDEDTRDTELLDGSFDQHFTPDISLENILEQFMPEFSMKSPEVGRRSIHIVIIGRPRRIRKEASLAQSPAAQEALRRTYARYFISFAAQNDDATCMNALRKIARYGRNA